MSHIEKRSLPAFWAAAAFAASLILFYFTVLSVPTEKTTQASLHPWPDGAEYVDAARSLVEQGSYSIHVAGRSLPPRYPPGYSSLIALAMAAGVAPQRAPYPVNSLAGLLLLGGLFALIVRTFGLWEAGLASLFLATLPAFSILARSPMSDLISALVLLCSLYLLYRHAAGAGISWAMAGSLLLGASLLLRISNALYLPFLLASVWARPNQTRRLVTDTAKLLAAFAVGLLPLLLFHWQVYGSPLATGYGYWLQRGEPDFALRHVPVWAEAFWGEITQQEAGFRTASLYGSGSYFGPAFVVLALLGLGSAVRNRLFWSFGLASAATAFALSCFYYQDFRLALPLLIMAVPWAASGSVFLLRQSWGKSRLLTLPALVLVLCGVVGWPPKRSDTELGDMLRPVSMHFGQVDFDLVRFSEQIDPGRGRLILTNMPPPYVHAVSEGERVIVPIHEEYNYRFNPPNFSFGVRERDELLRDALARGWTVLALLSRHPVEQVSELCPPPPGWEWETQMVDVSSGGVARLTQ